MTSGTNKSILKIRSTAKEIAGDIRNRHNLNHYPVPVESIANREGAVIRYENILSEGSLSRTGKGYTIRISEDIHPHRQRFTIAHEIGHILLEKISVDSWYHTYSEALEMITSKKDEERFCDHFASYLLIPDNVIVDLSEWKAISFQRLLKRAYELKVSLSSLIWRVLEQAPHEGGALWFRTMGKPSNPIDVKLRLDWGVFPKSDGFFLPRFAAVRENSPIQQALDFPHEKLYEDVVLDFGNLRERRTLLLKGVSQRVLAIVIPKEISPRTMFSKTSEYPKLPIDLVDLDVNVLCKE